MNNGIQEVWHRRHFEKNQNQILTQNDEDKNTRLNNNS